MQFNKLIRLSDYYKCLALSNRLMVFDGLGDLVAEWRVLDSRHEYRTWSFVCIFDNLPDYEDHKYFVNEWKKAVDAELMKEFNLV